MILTSKQKENIMETLEKEFWEKYSKVAVEVIAGYWGNGSERRQLLQEAGYNFSVVQTIVNELLAD